MRRNEEDLVLVERDGGSSLRWFLIGGVLGAGLALLFAPQAGDKTRRAVGRRLSKLRDAADEALSELKEAMSPEERVRRSLADRDGAEADDEVEAPGTPRPKAASARMELEQRLAEARARRQKAVADEDEEPVA